ncbi:adenosylmethionine-8-amino-7-oxononanoate aminotransferase [Candidatus Liberibacter solanacearum]|uniref:Adenosylmethionine-8-amino-7-oxononanoate aminotransferase n=1 Tax=Candidatus Liberibacter solanacearum TaxID=556287 RepID=A0A095BEF6_9HYPH|nr:adenosylmethionine--8-amino-7-oxononanoate transaminase [Candidatus Liberibacter solanacearum]KGB27193.1 adenosylmethionine-8-amino-7-oxononanoate aminotransferase [Candidatus Liberibacter solanacearum]KJZ81003.1 adenosylmethionine-8-amino-7-oxononanoate aminotransferase [Candidatus Liberibacter solanacearum]KJZ82176.1 Adenosylmethionine-8-amino-7-oxononanoate aminotransferase [Candidatus Liberibacter solanacearum]KQC49390.1 adenosylmethionine-8-amino-7-oxononanoate aminotransferase [Candida
MNNSNYKFSIWHPFVQHFFNPTFNKIIKTQGTYLIDEDHNKIIDAISSWWVITHGHCYPKIMRAIRSASKNYDQIIFAEYTHEPAEKLAKSLIKIVPPGLQYVFFSDSGSTSVEVALKMALGFFYNNNIERHKIVVMEHGYHGDTIGAMSVGMRGAFNNPYQPLLFDVEKIPFPYPNSEQETIDCLEQHCRTKKIAALLIEPLILGAGGMKTYRPYLLKEFIRITKKYDTLLIADEVMTGWGRTGELFACNHANITPDILCLSKGITGGALPLAATLCSEEIFDSHVSSDPRKTFFHSSSYTANPIACAAALANLKIWQKEPVMERIKNLEKMHADKLLLFQSNKKFINIRQIGTIVALDLNVQNKGYFFKKNAELKKFFREKNILIRPLGNVIYLMPPYCITSSDIDHIYNTINEAVDFLEL